MSYVKTGKMDSTREMRAASINGVDWLQDGTRLVMAKYVCKPTWPLGLLPLS